jgi:riboflavin biosynthesis pyrimidine reductase
MTTDARGAGLPLETLWSAPAPMAEPRTTRGRPMSEVLRDPYGGPLDVVVHPDRPTLLVNFATIDGVVALGPGEEPGGGVISGFFEPDRFVMALLRAVSDVLLVGARTLAGSSSTDWTAEHLQPDLAPALRAWRRDLGLAPQPTAVIVTGSGDVRLGRRGVDDPEVPVVFATTPSGERRLRDRRLPAHVTVEVVGSGDRVAPDELATFLARYRDQVVLSEGGPHLLGGLVTADLVDEIFLTLAPQVIGRDGGRFGLVEGLQLDPYDARWLELVSLKRAADHLFLRYRRPRPPAGPSASADSSE